MWILAGVGVCACWITVELTLLWHSVLAILWLQLYLSNLADSGIRNVHCWFPSFLMATASKVSPFTKPVGTCSQIRVDVVTIMLLVSSSSVPESWCLCTLHAVTVVIVYTPSDMWLCNSASTAVSEWWSLAYVSKDMFSYSDLSYPPLDSFLKKYQVGHTKPSV